MTSSFDPAADPQSANHARTALVPYRPRPSRWARAFRWWLGLAVVAFFAVALCVLVGYGHANFAPLHIVIDGDDLSDGFTINGLAGIGDGGRALLAFGAASVALLLVVLMPLVVLLLVGSVAIALVCGLGVPLVVLALVLAALTSPFWAVGLVVWLIARRRDSQRVTASATIAA